MYIYIGWFKMKIIPKPSMNSNEKDDFFLNKKLETLETMADFLSYLQLQIFDQTNS
jgi:hypothetical protein